MKLELNSDVLIAILIFILEMDERIYTMSASSNPVLLILVVAMLPSVFCSCEWRKEFRVKTSKIVRYVDGNDA